LRSAQCGPAARSDFRGSQTELAKQFIGSFRLHEALDQEEYVGFELPDQAQGPLDAATRIPVSAELRPSCARSVEIGPRVDQIVSRFCDICRRKTSTATGIRTRVSAVRGRPSIR
jgi:hypothetical protein